MNVLAFDTCFNACSVAVLRGAAGSNADRSIEPRLEMTSAFVEMATGHAERLLPMIERVLAESACTFADLNALAVTEGPGTFTGLRVGVATARALALAAGLPVRATTSLHVMAVRAAERLRAEGEMLAGPLAVSADARNGQVFVQLFSPSLDAITGAMLLSPEEAAALEPAAALTCVGSGAGAVVNAAADAGRVVAGHFPGLLPDARDLAKLASRLPVRQPLVPLYLRAADAKPQAGKSLPRA